MTRSNEFGQAIGDPVDWSPRGPVEGRTLSGRYVRLEPLSERHGPVIEEVLVPHPELWTYRREDPGDPVGMYAQLAQAAAGGREVPYAVVPLDVGELRGMVTLMRIDTANGVIEIGKIVYAPSLQRTRATTEATHLVAAHIFDDLGFRRFEWKCDSLNAASRRAARRLGFTEEGTFRNAMVHHGRNRDTTWFSITDTEWPRVKAAHQAWLAPENFDENGRQRRKLSEVFASLDA